MKTTTDFSEELRQLFDKPSGGVVNMVDRLLKSCPEEGLRLEWCSGQCAVHSPADNSNVLLSVPVTKSVFRGLLARTAVLCGETATPYSGSGNVAIGTDPARELHVAFANTTQSYYLELAPTSD